MEKFNVNDPLSKLTFEDRLADYFGVSVKAEDSSGSSALSAKAQGATASAGKPSLRDRMAEIGKKISEAHKNRKMKFRTWYMKSKFEKLEKKYKKERGYANTNALNNVGNGYLRKVAEEVREKLSTFYVQTPDLVDIAKGKWSDFKKIIDKAYSAVNEEIDAFGEVELEDDSNFLFSEWKNPEDERTLWNGRPGRGYPFECEDPFIKDFEEGF